jgi:hypothetical protein
MVAGGLGARNQGVQGRNQGVIKVVHSGGALGSGKLCDVLIAIRA